MAGSGALVLGTTSVREAPSAELQSRARVLTFTADGYDYNACFHAALRRSGLEVHKAKWSGRWLYTHVRSGDVVSLDWPSLLYYFPQSRLRTWVNLSRFLVLMLALRLRGAKIVWTAHNLYPHEGGRAVLAHRIGRYIVLKLVSFVGVHGPGAAALVQQEFSVASGKLALLEHGNWVGFHANTVTRQFARTRLDIPQDAYVFLFIGLCKPYKNLEHLLRSHEALRDDSLLWIVGRFQSQAYYRRVTQTALSGAADRRTVRNEFVRPDELQLYLNACDAVVLPYRDILTSGAAMLALSFGRPLVAPRLGTLAEVVTEDCGVLYDPGSDTGLTAAMSAVRRRPFVPDRILARAQQFSWDRSAEAFAKKILEIR
jgi:beta-1,4-mannosyltransferase